MDLAVQVDVDVAPLGKGVYHGHAHAVEAPGNLVGVLVEFAPGVELGHDQLQGADPFFGVDIHGDTPAIVLYPDNIVPLQDDQDIIAKALHGFVYRIVYNFIHQVMEAIDAGGPDIHAGAGPYCFESFEDFNILGRIRIACHGDDHIWLA
jgi:hypothetical protein